MVYRSNVQNDIKLVGLFEYQTNAKTVSIANQSFLYSLHQCLLVSKFSNSYTRTLPRIWGLLLGGYTF